MMRRKRETTATPKSWSWTRRRTFHETNQTLIWVDLN